METLQPKLRFPEFEGDLIPKRIDEIAPLQRGFDLPVNNIVLGNYPVVFSNGILKKHNQYKAKAPGVVTGRSGTIGKISFIEEDYWPHNTALWVTDFKNNSPKFIFYFYLQFDLTRFSTGSGVPTLNRNDVHNQIAYVPSFEEQTKIANFLSSIDEKIDLLKEKKAFLEEYKKGMMQKIFNQEIRFKDENGNDFEEWEEKKLNKLVQIFDGTHQTPNYVESGIPFFSVEHVTANQFSKTKFISREVFEKENKRVKLEKDDILMTRIGSIGVAKLIDWNVEASFYVSLALFKKAKKISNKYLAHFINSDFFQNELWKRTIHVAFPQKINLGEIGDCIVKFPCSKEQIKIANFLSAIDEKIVLVTTQIGDTQEYKKGLLQQMFV